MNALSSEDWFLRRRAVQELREGALSDQRAFTGLLHLLETTQIEGERYALIDSLARCVDTNCTTIYRTLSRLDAHRVVLLSCAIGRSGTSCSNVIALLRVKARDRSVSPSVSLAARVALANLDVDREESVAAIEQAVHGGGTQTEDLLLDMLLTRVTEWVPESIVSRVGAILQDGSDSSPLAAVLAATWEGKGQALLPLIRKGAERVASKTGHGGAAVVYACCAARLERHDGEWVSADLLKALAGPRVGFDHTVMAGYLLVASVLVNDADVVQLVRLLGDKDADVVLAAARLCWAVGMPAQGAEKRLLRVLQTTEQAPIRVAAASALGSVGSENCVPTLNAVMVNESWESVRSSLQASIKLINLKP